MATSGYSYMATSGDFPMAMDIIDLVACQQW